MFHQKNKLDTVLQHRSHLVEVAQREYAEFRERLSNEEDQLLKLEKKRKEVIIAMAERQNARIDTEEITLSHQFIKLQGDRIKDQKKKVRTLAENCETHRVRLEYLLQGKKAVENIKNKRLKKQSDLFKKNENAVLDEVSGRIERSMP